mgnify:CR=1 FL=1
MLFTFQYGEIKSIGKLKEGIGGLNLHSSMERLKATNKQQKMPLSGIYIPVWRD